MNLTQDISNIYLSSFMEERKKKYMYVSLSADLGVVAHTLFNGSKLQKKH